jgi:type I restriction-modification system DNA methylase subunit
MASMAKNRNNTIATTVGPEFSLWRTADALRSNIDTTEYKHVILPMTVLRRSWTA